MLTKSYLVRLASLAMIAVLVITLSAGCASQTPAPAPATTPSGGTAADDMAKEAAFYKDKVVNFIVPYATGGGYDSWARLLAPVMGKLTGATFVVKNVPGAGSLTGTNEMYVAEGNGLTIGIINGPGMMQSQLTDAAGVKFDLTKFTYLGRLTADQRVVAVNPKGKYKTIEAMRQSSVPVKFGAPGVGSSMFAEAALMAQALGIKLDLITGYDTSEEVDLAVVRGDLDAAAGSYASKQAMFKSGDLMPVLQYGKDKIADLPDVPMLTGLPNVNDEGKTLIAITLALGEVGRPIVAPPGVSATRLAYLESILKKALQDPDLLDLAKKQKMETIYLNSKDTAQQVNAGLGISAAQKKALTDILAKYQPAKK